MSVYMATIGGKEYAISISAEGSVSVKGQKGEIDVVPLGAETFSVLFGNHSTTITAVRIDDTYQVLLNNNQVDAVVESEREILLKKYATSSVATHQRYEIHAPMPALVVKVEVEVGDDVKPGQGLVILEAMKMENEIRSHRAGRVKEIYAAKGKPVDKGELLMLLE